MKISINKRVLILVFLTIVPVIAQAQQDNNKSELKNLGRSYAAAKAKVAANERRVAVADSLIESGNRLIAEAKAETRFIDEERNKLDKSYSARQKPLVKLSASKDKKELSGARADLKVLNTKYRSDAKALDNRLRDAAKKMTKGNSNIKKGKSARESARNSLKISQASLKIVQAKYDAAYFSGGSHNPNNLIFK